MGIVEVVGGVDTHADFHVAAAVDANGGLVAVERFGADEDGYQDLLVWLTELGEVTRVGVEGTGSYGVGLARFLIDADIEVVEVDRQNRQVRRKKGKSDPTDAVAAARAALSVAAVVVPKLRNGPVDQAEEPDQVVPERATRADQQDTVVISGARPRWVGRNGAAQVGVQSDVLPT